MATKTITTTPGDNGPSDGNTCSTCQLPIPHGRRRLDPWHRIYCCRHGQRVRRLLRKRIPCVLSEGAAALVAGHGDGLVRWCQPCAFGLGGGGGAADYSDPPSQYAAPPWDSLRLFFHLHKEEASEILQPGILQQLTDPRAPAKWVRRPQYVNVM